MVVDTRQVALRAEIEARLRRQLSVFGQGEVARTWSGDVVGTLLGGLRWRW